MNRMHAYTQKAFTIVELLIVIVVIAILAAISVVAYTGIQQRATESVVAQELAQFKRQMDLYIVDAGTAPESPRPMYDEFETTPSFNLDRYDMTINNNLLYCAPGSSSDARDWALVVQDVHGRVWYTSSRTSIAAYTEVFISQSVVCPQVVEGSTGGAWGARAASRWAMQ